ncbi:hypothetical protein SAFG77S_00893 [Streptomyces afghaniensis]
MVDVASDLQNLADGLVPEDRAHLGEIARRMRRSFRKRVVA